MNQIEAKLGIKLTDGKYTFDSDYAWSNAFTKIGLDPEFQLDGKSTATNELTSFVYTNGIYDLLFKAEHDKDLFTLAVTER